MATIRNALRYLGRDGKRLSFDENLKWTMLAWTLQEMCLALGIDIDYNTYQPGKPFSEARPPLVSREES